MILDSGYCKIYRRKATTPKGGKPTYETAVIHESYYGELAFETSPRRPTEGREETQTATRVRVLQNRTITNQDECELTPFNGSEKKAIRYRIVRAYHGRDEESGEEISDLTLEVYDRNMARKPVPADGNNTGGGQG